jgi:hypothetical protein
MRVTIDTDHIGNLVIFQGEVVGLPLGTPAQIHSGYTEFYDCVLKNGGMELQCVFRNDVGKKALEMEIKKKDKLKVIGYLHNDQGDVVCFADSVERV